MSFSGKPFPASKSKKAKAPQANIKKSRVHENTKENGVVSAQKSAKAGVMLMKSPKSIGKTGLITRPSPKRILGEHNSAAQTVKFKSGIDAESGFPVEVEANFKQVAGEQGDFPSTARNLFGLNLVEVSKDSNTQPQHCKNEQNACISTPERQMESACFIPKEDNSSGTLTSKEVLVSEDVQSEVVGVEAFIPKDNSAGALSPKDEKEVSVPEDEDVQCKVIGVEAYIVKDDVKVLVVEDDQNKSTGLEDGQGQISSLPSALYSNSNSGRCKRYLIFAALLSCLLVPVVLTTVSEGSAKGLWVRNAVTSRIVAIQAAWYDAHLKDRFLHISIPKKWRMQEIAWGDHTKVANLMIEQLQNRCYSYAQEMRQAVSNLVMKCEDVYSKYRIENIAGRLSNREDDNANISNNQAHVLSYNTSILLSSRVSVLEETSKTKFVYEDSQDERMCYWKDWTESFLFVCSNPAAKPEQDFMENHFVEHSIEDLEAPAEASQCDAERKSKGFSGWYFGSIIILVMLLPLAALLLRGNGKQSQPRKAKKKEANEELIMINTNDSPYGSFTALKRVVENEGDGKEKVRLTPVRRSSRIRNHGQSPDFALPRRILLSPA